MTNSNEKSLMNNHKSQCPHMHKRLILMKNHEPSALA